LKKICNLLSSYLVYLILTNLSLKCTLNVRNKKSFSKNCKVRATGGLRKQWEFGVKSKLSHLPPLPHTRHSPIGGLTGRLNSPIGGLKF